MSNHKLKFKRRKYIHSIKQSINLDLKYFMIKLRYLKSILQTRSSLLPTYCIFSFIHCDKPTLSQSHSAVEEPYYVSRDLGSAKQQKENIAEI